ncbi:hypothetical protein GGX14DRAFT_557980 [Mycena pura]|uniref:Uncharacterized protein n=1 Tax=Mycena pura TaxID=153505 RepID=A0AAD7E1B7_9AGAR|nr:hypothetical protein GGX14DRAFT_557980 [Mycena pura]
MSPSHFGVAHAWDAARNEDVPEDVYDAEHIEPTYDGCRSPTEDSQIGCAHPFTFLFALRFPRRRSLSPSQYATPAPVLAYSFDVLKSDPYGASLTHIALCHAGSATRWRRPPRTVSLVRTFIHPPALLNLPAPQPPSATSMRPPVHDRVLFEARRHAAHRPPRTVRLVRTFTFPFHLPFPRPRAPAAATAAASTRPPRTPAYSFDVLKSDPHGASSSRRLGDAQERLAEGPQFRAFLYNVPHFVLLEAE